MKESEASHAIAGYFNILEQLHVAKFVRTNSAAGMLLSYFNWQELVKLLKNGGSRSECLSLALKAASIKNAEEGWSDWTGVAKRKGDGVGQLVCVEIKAPGGHLLASGRKASRGKMSDPQKEMREYVLYLGGIWIEATCIDDVAKVISELTGHIYNRELVDRKHDDYDYSQIPF